MSRSYWDICPGHVKSPVHVFLRGVPARNTDDQTHHLPDLVNHEALALQKFKHVTMASSKHVKQLPSNRLWAWTWQTRCPGARTARCEWRLLCSGSRSSLPWSCRWWSCERSGCRCSAAAVRSLATTSLFGVLHKVYKVSATSNNDNLHSSRNLMKNFYKHSFHWP